MKSKQELIEKWESAIEAAEFYGKGKEERLISYMKDFVSDLNQLDEPETLSQEWLVEHGYNVHLLGTPDVETVAIPRDDLQNLLVPKQEEITVPEWFAEWYENKGYEMSLYGIFNALYASGKTEMEKWAEKYEMGHADLQRDIALIKEYGKDIYEIEEEPKYYVLLPEIVDNWRYVSLAPNHWGVTVRYTDTLDDVYAFTEQEIKDYDERYWAFAESVEEVEFRLSF